MLLETNAKLASFSLTRRQQKRHTHLMTNIYISQVLSGRLGTTIEKEKQKRSKGVEAISAAWVRYAALWPLTLSALGFTALLSLGGTELIFNPKACFK